MNLSHRPAARADLAQIVALYNATVPSRMVTADLEAVTVESRVDWFESHIGNRPLWVVELEGRVAAWLSFSSFYGRPAYRKTAEIGVYVDTQYRRRGIASYLLAEALARAPELKLATLLGFIFSHNEPSLALFAKFGFARWGLLPGVAELDGVERAVVILGRRVG